MRFLTQGWDTQDYVNQFLTSRWLLIGEAEEATTQHSSPTLQCVGCGAYGSMCPPEGWHRSILEWLFRAVDGN